MLTNIVAQLPLLWTHMLGCLPFIWSFPQTSLARCPPTMSVLLRSMNRLILLLSIFYCLMVKRCIMYFMYHSWNLLLVLYLVHLGILLLLSGLLQITLASSKLRISWIHALCTVVASLLRNSLFSGMGMIFLKLHEPLENLTNCPDVLSLFC